MQKIQEKMQAPDFELPDQTGEMQRLSDYAGAFVVLYFYPKDGSPGCSLEAQKFRDTHELLKQNGIVVLGVSADSVESHKEFHENENLTFDILSDENLQAIEAYESTNEDGTGAVRNSFLVNPEGNIKKIYENVEPKDHVEEILEDVQSVK